MYTYVYIYIYIFVWADCARDINTRYCRAVHACPSVQCSCGFALPCFRIGCSHPTCRLSHDINTCYYHAVPACPSVQCSCGFALPCFRIGCSPPTWRLSPPPLAGAFRHGLRAQGCTFSARCTLYTLRFLGLPVRPGRAGRWIQVRSRRHVWNGMQPGWALWVYLPSSYMPIVDRFTQMYIVLQPGWAR